MKPGWRFCLTSCVCARLLEHATWTCHCDPCRAGAVSWGLLSFRGGGYLLEKAAEYLVAGACYSALAIGVRCWALRASQVRPRLPKI